MRIRLHGFALACLLIAARAGAQPFTLDDKIKPTELKLETFEAGDQKTAGRLSGRAVTQAASTQYFFVQGLSIFSPDYVAIAADDPSSPLHVEIAKETWESPHLKGQTDAGGHWNGTFKTSGDFGIKVTADRLPATYALVVWSGNEVNAPMPSPFTRGAPGKTSPTSQANNTVLYVIIALLAGALIGVLLMKSKSSRACLLIASLVGASLLASTRAYAQYDKAVDALLKDLKQFLTQQESVEKFWQSLKTLSQSEAMPDEAQQGPSLPSSCVDNAWALPNNPGCACMTTAVDKLRKNRQMLEKLRVLVANQKNFVDKAIALGNSFSQLHTVLGLQWVGIRKHDIEEPYAQFKQTANQKHKDVMAAIQKDLQDISVCEAKLGEPDWYQKFGFMYYEFLYAVFRPAF